MPLARSLRTLSALLFVTVTVHAQSTQSPYTLSANARLVITDVSVTDSKGVPVRGLKQGDFQIAEDGKPQVIQAFDEQQQRTTALPINASVPQGVFSNIALGDLPKTTNVLLIDSFNSDVIDQMYLRIQLLRAVREFGGRSAVAVFAVNSGHASLLLQNFTGDPALLRAAIARELPRLTANGGNRIEHFQDALGSLSTISSYLSRIPGHKNLLWFSTYFPFTEQSPGFVDGFSDVQRQQLTHVYNQLSLDRVSVYPIDARGPDLSAAPPVGQEAAMDRIAAVTGGQAFYNRNDLGHVTTATIEGGANYYTLSYAPQGYVADNKFHAIKVSVAGGPYTLHYRSGYVAFDMKDDASSNMSGGRLAQANIDIDTLAAGGKLARTREAATSDSLTDYSRPGPSQSSILFEARIVPAAQVPGWQVLPPARDRKGKVVGDAHDQPFVIEYAALSKDLSFSPTAAGKQHAELLAAAMAYTETGEVVGTSIEKVELNFTPEQLQVANRVGTPLRQQIRLPKGSVFVSLSLIDNLTGHTGSLEIPFTAPHP